jgi:chemotaxis protein methyltransferase CheR
VETRKAVLGRVREVLAPGGYLLLGGAESTYGTDGAFERVEVDGAALYRVQGSTEA